jgi:anti-sigma28 factor (negative regulator of flagellin synthesis)
MISLQGVNGLPDPAASAPGALSNALRLQTPAFEPKEDGVEVDGVEISQAAEQAAVLVGQSSEIRRERIEEVKARLEQGAYKLQATVLMVAARVAPYVE